MAKKKKKKFPYKYITPLKLQSYKQMKKYELISTLILKNSDLKKALKTIKDSDYLKELKAEIKEFRDTHTSDELIQLKEDVKTLEEERDVEIENILEEKRDIEGGFRDSVNACKEHIDAILSLLPNAE